MRRMQSKNSNSSSDPVVSDSNNSDSIDSGGQQTNSISSSGDSSSSDSPDLSSKEFSVNNPSIPTVSVPPPTPIYTHDLPSTASTSSSSSSGGGGSDAFGVLGDVIGIGSKILPFFIAQGGPVGLAQGGVPQGHDKAMDMAMGYLTGALHQQKYGGTPDTLGQAAQEVQGRM